MSTTPNIPRAARAPQDRKTSVAASAAASAVQREAEGTETIEIFWEDLTFTIPADIEDLPAGFLDAMEQGRASRIIRYCIGAKAFQQLMKRRPRVRDLNVIGDQIAEAYGFDDTGN